MDQCTSIVQYCACVKAVEVFTKALDVATLHDLKIHKDACKPAVQHGRQEPGDLYVSFCVSRLVKSFPTFLQCSATCGPGISYRAVYCTNGNQTATGCDITTQPSNVVVCQANRPCCTPCASGKWPWLLEIPYLNPPPPPFLQVVPTYRELIATM